MTRFFPAKLLEKLESFFGRGLVLSLAITIALCLAVGLAAFFFLNSAAPRTLTITSGPEGSSFQRNADRYAKILARSGVTLRILPSEGSEENLRRLADTKQHIDVGFVLEGGGAGKTYEHLVSLGGVNYQPLMVFYRGPKRELLSQFAGKRVNIGPPGSGTNGLGRALLKANGIEPGGTTTFDETDYPDPEKALRDGLVDLFFVMGDSTSSTYIRKLLRDGDIRLFSFTQADAYVRRVGSIHKLVLPRGAIDLGADIPAEEVHLVGPTVQLIARESLHPALSDLLLEAAREIHSTPGLFRKRGDFPALHEGDFRISEDATRYFTSGKGFLYRVFPFWLATLAARILAFLVPIALLLIPAVKFAPTIYRWRIESRIYRWYQALLQVEQEAFRHGDDASHRKDLLHRLDKIESAVSRIVVPAAFGDMFYGLRGHIDFVRQNLLARGDSASRDSAATLSPGDVA